VTIRLHGSAKVHRLGILSRDWQALIALINQMRKRPIQTKQDKTGHRHFEESGRSEFFTHGAPPLIRNGGEAARETRPNKGGCSPR
jgi:hypothetical protein